MYYSFYKKNCVYIVETKFVIVLFRQLNSQCCWHSLFYVNSNFAVFNYKQSLAPTNFVFLLMIVTINVAIHHNWKRVVHQYKCKHQQLRNHPNLVIQQSGKSLQIVELTFHSHVKINVLTRAQHGCEGPNYQIIGNNRDEIKI